MTESQHSHQAQAHIMTFHTTNVSVAATIWSCAAVQAAAGGGSACWRRAHAGCFSRSPRSCTYIKGSASASCLSRPGTMPVPWVCHLIEGKLLVMICMCGLVYTDAINIRLTCGSCAAAVRWAACSAAALALPRLRPSRQPLLPPPPL